MNPPVQIAIALAAAAVPLLSFASSHREAPNIAGSPKVDGTDLYLFRSYEPGRAGFVTLLANYIPFQDPGGGPNFYQLDPHAIYAINVLSSEWVAPMRPASDAGPEPASGVLRASPTSLRDRRS
jgi:hypothetical protein